MSQSATNMLMFDYDLQFRLFAQQKQSKLENAVLRGPSNGERKRHDALGQVDPVEVTARHQDTPFTPVSQEDRWSVARKFVSSDFLDSFDVARTRINDPQGTYVMAQVAGLNRQKDRLIQSGLSGTVITGQTGTGSSSFPAANQIDVDDHDYDEAGGTGDVGMTYYKILRALQVLEEAAGGLDSPVHGILGSREKNALIASTKGSSTLFVGETERTAFQTGKISNFLGIEWHILQDSLITVDGSADRLMHIWLQDGMMLDMNTDLFVRITERDDKNFSTQVYASWELGVVRLDDAKVAQVATTPTAPYL